MKHIPISSRNGIIGWIMIDDEDADLFEGVSLCLNGKGKHSYATFRKNTKKYYAHKVIAERMGLEGQIDHRDRNKWNCCRSNLRLCSSTQNRTNHGMRKDNKSGFKGVSYSDRPGRQKKWVVQIHNEGRRICNKYFQTPVEAARFYDQKMIELHGHFATTNAMLGLYPDQKEGA